jgi:hypothetical protein
MSYEKFIVLRLETTPSGNYAEYLDEHGRLCLTSNFGYNVNDIVELWDYDGYAPKRIDVNGIQIWNEEDRIKWWKNYDPDGYIPK